MANATTDFRALATVLVENRLCPADFVGLDREEALSRIRTGIDAHRNLIWALFARFHFSTLVFIHNPEAFNAFNAADHGASPEPRINIRVVLTSMLVRAGLSSCLPTAHAGELARNLCFSYNTLIHLLHEGTDPMNLPDDFLGNFYTDIAVYLTEMYNNGVCDATTSVAFYWRSLNQFLAWRASMGQNDARLPRINQNVTRFTGLLLEHYRLTPEPNLTIDERIALLLNNANAAIDANNYT